MSKKRKTKGIFTVGVSRIGGGDVISGGPAWKAIWLKRRRRKKWLKIALAALVIVLLILGTREVMAAWSETRSTQVTANILPLPEGTFQITSAYCTDAMVGYEAPCTVYVTNQSPTLITVVTATVATTDPRVTITATNFEYRAGSTFPPGYAQPLVWTYMIDPSAVPGEAVFDFEVICSGE